MTFDTTTPIRELLAACGLTAEQHEDWLAPNGKLPALRGSWHEETDDTASHLEVEVLLPDRRALVEVYASGQAGIEGCREAFEDFLNGSFHVLLAALWGRMDPERVCVEEWSLGARKWNACIGRFRVETSGSEGLPLPDALFPALQAAFEAEACDGTLHWIQTFVCHTPDGNLVHQALLDNERWVRGEEALGTLPWPRQGEYYCLRNLTALSLQDGADRS